VENRGCVGKMTAGASNGHRPKILLLGDSLTQTSFEGWGSKLSDIYQRRADVINRGCSGFNTTFYCKLIEKEMDSFDNVCLVTIWFGANDASLPDLNPHHYVSIEDYADNLKCIVERVREKYESPHIILITPPPVQHEQRLVYQKQRYGDKATGVLERTLENAGKYANTCKDVARELKIPCLDLFNNILSKEHDTWSRLFSDGLHFSKDGHDFVANELIEIINDNYPELKVTPDQVTGQWNNSSSSCSGIPSWGPYHDQICRDDMDQAFSSS
jgi:isoamyl acetate esterase